MSEIVFLVGLPGVGKSTYIAENYPNHVIVSNDMIVEEFATEHNIGYNEAWEKVSFKDVNRKNKNIFEDAVKNGKSIVVDNTNMTIKSRRKYNPAGYIKNVVLFDILNDEEWERRVEKRKNETGKLVPFNAIENMKKIYQRPTKKEGFNEIKIVYVK